MIAPLRQRNFRLAWCGGLIVMVGDWALYVALPVSVYELTGSALATSGMFVAQLVPTLLVGSVASVSVDRWDRRRTLVNANLVLALVVLPLLAVRSADAVWIAYLVGAGQAVVGQFVRPAEGALLPKLVAAEHLLPANALNALNDNLARLLGPALGGSLIGFFGLPAVVLLDAVCFLLAASLIARISVSGKAEGAVGASGVDRGAVRRVGREWLAGLAVVRRSRAVATLLALQGIGYLGEGVFGVMFVVWVTDILAGGARELGWFMSAQAVGGLLGGMLLGPLLGKIGTVRLLGLGSVVFGLLDLALFNYPRVVAGLWPGLVLIGLVGVPAITIGATFATLLQRAVGDEFRGRVIGVFGTTSAVLRLTGTVVAGALGGAVGPLLLLNVQGGAYVALGLLALTLLPRALAKGRPEGGAGSGG